MSDNETRDRCLELLARAEHARFGSDDDSYTPTPWESTGPVERESWRRIATPWVDALLAEGWRPPARVIEHQAQLSGWPIGTVIRDAQDGVARRTRMGDGPAWIVVGGWAGSGRPVALPAVVLYEPEEDAS